ncbi:putative membrane protein [Weissella oryzae SG25]|uniref:Putative membrane protein n=1 Tax=Weissella oryzae (strain DSM 25784 / JCM 18191 / LMG 30913 / SG25) TaxID=1329250 RepID=A0A069CTA6_WEIOS|nr:DUF805 domain-containing protein [Weissella oryzae]GAK30694.1 putative membrane protein [Weissella oryzae SG25]
MIESYKKFWVNIFDFSGVSGRADYWWPVIINYILGLIIGVSFGGAAGILPDTSSVRLAGAGSVGILYIISIIIWIATLSVKFRRLHDTNRSGFWILINFVPVIGNIWFIILMLLPSKQSRWN